MSSSSSSNKLFFRTATIGAAAACITAVGLVTGKLLGFIGSLFLVMLGARSKSSQSSSDSGRVTFLPGPGPGPDATFFGSPAACHHHAQNTSYQIKVAAY